MTIVTMLREIRAKAQHSPAGLAQLLGASLVSVHRWERGAGEPSPAQAEQIRRLYKSLAEFYTPTLFSVPAVTSFGSRGVRRQATLQAIQESVIEFLSHADTALPTSVYLHVSCPEETDFRRLYSDWLSQSLLSETELLDSSKFRVIAQEWLDQKRKYR